MTRTEKYVPEGSTLASILAGLELESWKDCLVAVDGIPVEAQWWPNVRVKRDHLVTVRAIPRGGGGGGGESKSWIMIAAGIILVVAGILLSPYTAGFSLYLVPLGIGLALSGAVSLIFPPPSLPKLKAGASSDLPLYSITGTRNTVNPWGAAPSKLGL